MTEPALGAGALAKATTEGIETSKHLLGRLLGPTADVYGDYLADRASAQIERNRRRLAERTLAKARGKEAAVNARVAYRVIQEASVTENEVLAEYLSGVLASSRTPDGKDDSGISWISVLSMMSSAQIRAHFLLYREWAELLRGSDLNLAWNWVRDRSRIWADYQEFEAAIGNDSDPSRLQHAMIGLQRNGLIEGYSWGSRTELAEFSKSPYPMSVAAVPSPAGFELYAWAQGSGDMPFARFPFEAEVFDTEPSTPRLTKVVLEITVNCSPLRDLIPRS
jgi:hypothetical protein